MGQVQFDHLYDQFQPAERMKLLLEAMARGDEAEISRLRNTCPRKTYVGPDLAFEERMDLAHDTTAAVTIDLRSLCGRLDLLHWAIDTVRKISTLHSINTEMAFLEGIRCGKGLPQMHYFAKVEDESNQEPAVAADEAETMIDEWMSEPKDGDGAAAVAADDYGRRFLALEERSEQSTESQLLFLRRAARDMTRELASIWEAFCRFSITRPGLPGATMLRAHGMALADDVESMLKRHPEIDADKGKVEKYARLICAPWDQRFGTDLGF